VSLFLFLFGALALGVFFFEPNKSWFDWVVFIAYFFWTGAALCGTIYGLRTRIEATEIGVRWRDWRGVWRAAKWEEIRDFYRGASQKSSGYNVETTQGNFQFDSLGAGKALAEFIAERATNAGVRQWEIKGERLVDEWPRRFEFCRSGRNHASLFSLLGLLGSLILVAASLLFWVPPRADLSVIVWFLAYVGPLLLLPILPMVIGLFVFIRAREAQPFRGQSVEVSPTGIVFSGSTRIEAAYSQIEAAYSQIEACHWIKRGGTRFLQLEIAGATIETPTFIAGFRSLCRILERFSGVPLVKEYEEGSMPAIPVQAVSDGALIFGFYDENVLMMVWLSAVMGAILFFVPFIEHLADPQMPPHASPRFLGISVFLISIVLNRWFRAATLRLTPDFLEWRAPFLHRTIAWKDIESYGSTPTTVGWIESGKKKINLSYLWIPVAQRSRLHAEIEKRALNAKGHWDTGKASDKI